MLILTLSLPLVTISIHALLAESDRGESGQRHSPDISIHALLAESDSGAVSCSICSSNFYPRSPCGERRDLKYKRDQTILFLSTLSLRRATRLEFCDTAQHTYFYPRSPCGERRKPRRLKSLR